MEVNYFFVIDGGMEHTLLFWILFHFLILGLFLLDLGVLRRHRREMEWKEAVRMSVFWIFAALCFNVFIYFFQGKAAALEFLAAYLIEKSLSVDNLFVFLLIFSSFGIKPSDQHKILFLGVVEALLFRMVFILAGVAIIRQFHWVLYLFGIFLILTAVRFLFQKEQKVFSKESRLYRFVAKIFPLTDRMEGGNFTLREQGKLKFTPLFLVLLGVEFSDILFAIDSIPAVFAVTNDAFIAYTSNVFAILGLRALYFCLAPLLNRLQFIKYGLALILLFVGVKMLLGDAYSISTGVSLCVVFVILLGTVLFSVWRRPST